MATRSKMKPKSMAAVVRSATAIATDIVNGLRGLGTAKEAVGKVYREAAETLHGICPTFTDLQWTRCNKSEESAKTAYREAGMDAATFAKVSEFRKTILDAVKAYNEAEAKTVWQNICRWSPGYTGSKPNHPDASAKIKAEGGAESKAGTKAKAETETDTVSVSDQVEKTPQFARIVISQVVGGLTARMGLMKKEKLSTSNIKAAIDALGEAMEYIALMK